MNRDLTLEEIAVRKLKDARRAVERRLGIIGQQETVLTRRKYWDSKEGHARRSAMRGNTPMPVKQGTGACAEISLHCEECGAPVATVVCASCVTRESRDVS